MIILQSVQHHTGLTHPFQFFEIWALWRSGLNAMSAQMSKKLKSWVRPVWRWMFWCSFLPQSEKVWEQKGYNDSTNKTACNQRQTNRECVYL